MWILFAFLSAITAAFVALFGKMGLKGVDATLATTLRGVVMALFLVVASLMLGKFRDFHFNDLSGKEWGFILLAAIAGALSWLFYFLALKTGTATKVAAIDRTSILFIVLLAALFLGESFTTKSAVGVLFIAGGAMLLVLS